MNYNIFKIQESLKELQQKKRFLHTLGVQYTSANLAMCHGCDVEQAQIAGLLHDCAKYMPDSSILMKCKKNSIAVSPLEERNAFLLHAKLGAYYARSKYSIEEEEILNAITYHTTGRPDMTLLEKIVFIADYIEPSRKRIDGIDEIRKTAYIDLNKTMYLVLKNTLDYLELEKTKEVDPLTYKTYEYYKNYLWKGVHN